MAAAKSERGADSRRRDPSKPTVSVGKKLLFSALTLVAAFVLLELGMAVFGVSPVTVEEDPYLGFSGQTPLFESDGDQADVLVTAHRKKSHFNHQQFSRLKPKGTKRIFCLGGSTTYGRPFDDRTSFCAWLRELLPNVDPSSDWEVINAGGISYASYRVALVMQELVDYQPDLFIIYSGHNEFLEQRTYTDLLRQPEFVRKAGGILSQTRIYAAMRQVLRPRPDTDRDMLTGEVNTRLDHVVGPRSYSRHNLESDSVLAHYRYNLTRMIDLGRSVGATVLLVVPASNERDFSPFKSEHRPGLSVDQEAQVRQLIEDARKSVAAEDWDSAASDVETVLKTDDLFAELHFLHGQILYRREAYEDAKSAFWRAIDEDVCPLRAVSAIPKTVREVAARYQVPLVDFEKVCSRQSPHGVPGDDLFLDHVHPTIAGHGMLAMEIVRTLIKQQWLKGASPDDDILQQVTRRIGDRVDESARATALLNLSKVLGWAGKFAASRRLAREAAALTPNAAEAHYNVGITLQVEGKPREAAKEFREAIRLAPGVANAYVALAKILLDQGDAASAAAHLRQAIELEPELAGAHEGLGEVKLARRDPETAIVHLEKAISLGRKTPHTYRSVAHAYTMTGQLPKAVTAFEHVVQLQPSDVAALASLANILATCPDPSVRDGQRAVEAARKASDLMSGRRPELLNTLAAAYAESGDFDAAIRTATRALELSSQDPRRSAEIQRRLELYKRRQPFRMGP